MRIDVHTHYRTPRFLTEMASAGAEEELENFSYYGVRFHLPKAEAEFRDGASAAVQQRLTWMDEAGIDRSILGLGGGHPSFADPAKAVDLTQLMNDELEEASRLSGGRLGGFACLPLPHVEESLREIARIFDTLGLEGVNLGCSVSGKPLDSPEFEPVWEALDQRSAVVLIHPGTTPKMGVGALDYRLSPTFGSPAEIAIAICRLIVAGVPTRYPRLRFLGATGGGSLPFFAHRFDSLFAKTNPDLAEHTGGVIPYLRDMWWDTSVANMPLFFAGARLVFGTDRLVLGSDAPMGVQSQSVSAVTSADELSEDEKTVILDLNAELLFADHEDDCV